MDKGFTGRWNVNSLQVFSGLKIRMICTDFHCAGEYPLSKAASKNWVRYSISIVANYLRILPVLRWYRDDLLGSGLPTSPQTSTLLIRLVGSLVETRPL
jgi:hypothetical protein